MLYEVITASPVIIQSLDVNASGSGTATVYYKAGTHIGSETNSGAWTLVGSYPIAASGVQNIDVADFTIPAGTTYGIYINYPANYTTGANTYSNADITIDAGTGLCSAFGGTNYPRTFNGTLYYSSGFPSTPEWHSAPSLTSTTLGTGTPS